MIMKATFGQHLRSTGSSDSRPSLFFPPISSSSSSSSSQSSSFTGAAMLYWNKVFSIVYGVCTELRLWAGEYYFHTKSRGCRFLNNRKFIPRHLTSHTDEEENIFPHLFPDGNSDYLPFFILGFVLFPPFSLRLPQCLLSKWYPYPSLEYSTLLSIFSLIFIRN